MKIQYHVWSFLLPVFVFLAFELILIQPSLVFYMVPALLLAVFAAVYFVLGRNLKTPSSRWYFWFSPAVFYLSSSGLFFLLETTWSRQALIIFAAVMTGLFLEGLYTYIWEHESYETYALENISGYMSSASLFFLSAGVLGFVTFMQISIWFVIVPVCLIYFLLTWQTFWYSKIPWQTSRSFILLTTIILAESFFVMNLLPVHYLIGGAVLLIIWYVVANLLRIHLLGYWRRATAVRYFITSMVLIGFLLSMTRWV